MKISIFLLILLIGFFICVLKLLENNYFAKKSKEFYENLMIGDKYHYISDSNVFIQPVEVIEILDKRDGYIKYSILKTKTGKKSYTSCSCVDFYDIVTHYGLVKQEN